LINFFYNFYKEWPNLKKVPTYIVGQSYGAIFAPLLAKQLLTNQTFRAEINLNIKGMIISSGWIDPINQINYYDSLLYSLGIVSNRFRDALSSIQSKSLVNIFKRSYKNASDNYFLLSKNSSLF
jgi:carboxypeptidase C (cathepsin A)